MKDIVTIENIPIVTKKYINKFLRSFFIIKDSISITFNHILTNTIVVSGFLPVIFIVDIPVHSTVYFLNF